MAKKRVWWNNDKAIVKKEKKHCLWDCKIAISKEALDDWRITKNELVKELTEVKDLLVLKRARIADLELKVEEQEHIINDTFDSMIELSDKIDWYKLGRNISIAVNVVLIILLILCM